MTLISRMTLTLAIASVLLAHAAQAAEVKMNLAGHDADGVDLVELSVGEQVVVEYRVVLSDGDTLSTVFFSNEAVSEIAQMGVTASPSNWSEGSTDGASLGNGGQQVALAAANPLSDSLVGPGEFLIGAQTLELIGGAVGDEFEVTFSTIQLGVVDESAMFFTFTASGSQFEDEIGFFHLGIGSPGYTRNMTMDIREPLIVRVAQGSTGGGGGGGGGGGSGGGNDNDNSAGNDNGNTNDNGNGNDNSSGNDNSNSNQNTNDNGNQNSNDNGSGNGNDNGGNDNGGNDNGNTNGNANDNGSGNDNANGNQNANDNSGGNGNDQPQGLCGLGMVAMLPLNLIGLLAMRRRRRIGF